MTDTLCPPAIAGRRAAWACTRKLELREFVPTDLDEVLQMHREPRLRAHLVDDYPLHEPAVARVFLWRLGEIYREHEGLGIWHATRLETLDDGAVRRSFAGWFNLMPMAEHPGEVELGSRLLPQAWGSGLALEGGELLLDHAFGTLGLERVWGICHPGNRSARTVLATMGFASRGVQLYDSVPASHYEIDLNAWRATRNSPRASRLRRVLRALQGGPAQPDAPHEPRPDLSRCRT